MREVPLQMCIATLALASRNVGVVWHAEGAKSVSVYRDASLIRNRPPPYKHQKALGMVLL